MYGFFESVRHSRHKLARERLALIGNSVIIESGGSSLAQDVRLLFCGMQLYIHCHERHNKHNS